MKFANFYWYRKGYLYLVLFLMLSCFGFNVVRAIPPPVGSLIGNQAVATYQVAGVEQTAMSNMVTTIVTQVAQLSMTGDNNLKAIQSAAVIFTHQITNNGNGNDSFELSVAKDSTSTLNFALEKFKFYADANSDGRADNDVAITRTPVLRPGESFSFVLSGYAPAVLDAGKQAVLSITVNSVFDNKIQAINKDTFTVVDGGVIAVEKTMRNENAVLAAKYAAYPGDTIAVRLNYRNIGSKSAQSFRVEDSLPVGLTYKAGSAKWVKGNVTTNLKDGDGANNPHVGVKFISGQKLSFEFTTPLLPATGADVNYVEFEVTVNAGLAPQLIVNSADIFCNCETTETSFPRVGESNKATLQVFLSAKFDLNSQITVNGTLNRSASDYLTPGIERTVTRGVYSSPVKTTDDPMDIYPSDTVSFQNLLVNLGNGQDTYNLTVDAVAGDAEATSVAPGAGQYRKFPSGTLFVLFDDKDIIRLTDTNADGVVDTGPIDPIGTKTEPRRVYLRVVLPSNIVVGQQKYRVRLTATSTTDSTKSFYVDNVINEVLPTTVDLVQFDNSNWTGAEQGIGQGPEAEPVKSVSVAEGADTTFALRLKHLGGATSYRLEYSTDKDFKSVNGLPEGWRVTFYARDGGTDPIDSVKLAKTARGVTTPINSDFIATIIIPKGAVAGNNEIYFRVRSARLNVMDILHDRVTISATHSLNLGESQQGQIFPGGSALYLHSLSNNGNVTENRGKIDVKVNPSTGWSAVLYLDTDRDGKVTPNVDVELTDLSKIYDGKGLAAREQVPIILLVQAPAGAEVGTEMRATIRINIEGGSDDAPIVLATFEVTDTAVVTSGFVKIQKTQLLDADCNTKTITEEFSSRTINARPGQCIFYRVTLTNLGTTDVSNVNLDDKIPVYTLYDKSSFAGKGYSTSGPEPKTPTLPKDGASGNDGINVPTTDIPRLNFVWDKLAPSGVVSVTYRVKVMQ